MSVRPRFPLRRRLLAAWVLLPAVPAVAGPLDRTDPAHQPPLPPGGYDLPLAPPVVRFPLPSQWMTINKDLDWRKAGIFDKKLSAACATRTFTETLPLRFRAAYRGEILGVAFGYGLNLTDPGKLADPKMIYLFRNGDSTQCGVLKLRNDDPRVKSLPDKPAAAAQPAGPGRGAAPAAAPN